MDRTTARIVFAGLTLAGLTLAGLLSGRVAREGGSTPTVLAVAGTILANTAFVAGRTSRKGV